MTSPIVVVERLRAIEHDEREVRHRVRLPRSGHAFGFDRVGRRAKARRIDERHAQAVEVDRFRDQVARRARDVGHDRARGAGERVEDARLAHVRLADDRDLQSLAHEPSAARRRRAASPSARIRSSIAPASAPGSMK